MVTKIEDGEDPKLVRGMMQQAALMGAAAASVARPPSTASVPGPRTTSRRGGRTRSRSPAVGSARPPSATASDAAGAENPSSAAAAAAAAAAKVGNWADRPEETLPYAAAPPGGYGKWPQDDAYRSRSRFAGNGYPTDGYINTGSSSSNNPQQQPHHQHHPHHHQRREDVYGDRRYRGRPYDDPHHRGGGGSRYYPQHDYRYNGGGGGSSSHHPQQQPPPPQHAQHPHHPPSGYRGGGPSGATPKRTTGTNLVIGGTTPIHVPKTPGGERGSAASVFRGRPEDHQQRKRSGSGNRAGGNNNNSSSNTTNNADDDDDENSPQKILLSLRTPTMSFDDSGGGPDKEKKTDSGLSLSPTGPPNLQNSSSQQRGGDQLLEKGPGDEPKAGIDMASSFNLFNQSFDSFGGDYFNVDASLHNDSFGIGRAGSHDHEGGGMGAGGNTQVLHGSSSAGNFSSTQLLAPSASANLSIGYSPVNSFGNPGAQPPPPPHRNGSMMMVLGGNDQRSASPSQVLGMYRSYSGSRPDDGHGNSIRMGSTGGSFGAHSHHGRPHGGEHGGSSSSYYYGSGSMLNNDGDDRNPPFYSFLVRHKGAFVDCTFLLPGLKAALASKTKPEATSPYMPYGEPVPEDTAIARRRVESSVCAFGGSVKRKVSIDQPVEAVASNGETPTATVTPSSSVTSPPRRAPNTEVSKSRKKYETDLPTRYYENESRLSWEFEENPPVVVEVTSDKDEGSSGSTSDHSRADHESKDSKDSGVEYCKPIDSDPDKKSSPTSQSKMKYRCKLCGQPKQNHTCPYQQSLARSIGINVYPTVNAFTAAEPGTIALPLSEMNNFVEVPKEGGLPDTSPSRPAVTSTVTVPSGNQVTPDSLRSTPRQGLSPVNPVLGGKSPPRGGGSSRRGPGGKKRSRSQLEPQADALFAESMELKTEQFRTVTPLEAPSSSGRDLFEYPSLPLPYAQRKKLSDNLFSLSNDVPKLTDECAKVLREAREKDLWDLAVAELMTQVVVVIHCAEGDHRFEGLRQYLLTLGIAS